MKFNPNLKAYIKKNKKKLKFYYYEYAPKNLKKNIHNYVTIESSKKILHLFYLTLYILN